MIAWWLLRIGMKKMKNVFQYWDLLGSLLMWIRKVYFRSWGSGLFYLSVTSQFRSGCCTVQYLVTKQTCSSRWMQIQDGKVQACFLFSSWLSSFLSYFLRPPLCVFPSPRPSAWATSGLFSFPPTTAGARPTQGSVTCCRLIACSAFAPSDAKNHMHMDARRGSCPFEHVPAAHLSPANSPNNPLSVWRAALERRRCTYAGRAAWKGLLVAVSFYYALRCHVC